jgi:hypothetical protein
MENLKKSEFLSFGVAAFASRAARGARGRMPGTGTSERPVQFPSKLTLSTQSI